MKTIITNWKANPTTLEDALDLFDFCLSEMSKYQNIRLVVCPPFVYLEELAKRLEARKQKSENISLGAQDMFWEKSGPFTGEISVDMLKEFGITHVLLGHSDRRYPPAGGGETDEMINKKIKSALEAGIVPVLLVGEHSQDDDRRAVLEQQLFAGLGGLSTDQVSKILITYEPVWAISTQPGSKPDTPENTLEAIKTIREFVALTYNLEPITCLYGGSVNEKNVADFLGHSEISGAVVGAASLHKEEFAEILKTVSGPHD